MTYPHCWPNANHPLWWTQMEVSTTPYYKRTLKVSLLPVGRIAHQDIQQLSSAETVALNPRTNVEQRRGRFPLVCSSI